MMEIFGNILVIISGITWTIVYIELIRKGFKDKACGMPLFALTLNFAWEVIYALDGLFFSKSFILPQTIANVVWAFFDIFILVTWFKYGKKYMSENAKKYFISYTILALIVGFVMQIAFYVSCNTKEIASIYSAYAQNVAMSIMFVITLFRRGNTKGVSLIAAISKCIGTLTPTIYGAIFALKLGLNNYIILTGILCFVFDLIYIYFLTRLKKQEEALSDESCNLY